MKTFLFSVLVLALTLPLRADNWLENGDFADGTTHWHGDIKSPADFAPENPFDKPDPFTSKGLIVSLKHSSWCKVAQDFKGKISSGVLTITYMVAPDLTFSTRPDDYVNMPDHIGYDGWMAFNTPPGDWVVFVSDFGSAHGTYYEIKPKRGTSAPQTYRAPVKGLTPLEDKTMTLAFPPGQGNIVILSISLTDK